MLKKFKKFFPVIISAVLCVSMAFGMTVSAQSVESCWSECVKLANSSFDQNYIDLAIKYHNKEAKNTIAFGKSKTKKFIKNFNSKIISTKNEFSLEMSDRNNIILFAQKGSKLKIVECEEGYGYNYDYGIAYFSDGKSSTALSLKNKTKTKVPDDVDPLYTISDLITDEFDMPDDDMTGKYFKFKSGGKIYYYEEFTIKGYFYDDTIGALFDENGNILAMLIDYEVYCVSFKTTVDDSEFDIPKGYKTVDFDDFDY